MQHFLWNMYSRIQNGLLARKKVVVFPKNRLCLEVLKIFYKEGYINGFRINPQNCNKVEIFLKYNFGKPVFSKIVSPSKPGRRLYLSSKAVWKLKTSMTTLILSTPAGIMSDKECRKYRFGGELLCTIL